MLHLSGGGCLGCRMTHCESCGHLLEEEVLDLDVDGGVVGEVAEGGVGEVDNGEDDEVGKWRELLVVSDAEECVVFDGDGGQFDNEIKDSGEEDGLHGLSKLLLSVS